MKKTIAILMSLVMALSVFAMAVSAEGVQDNFRDPLAYDFEDGDCAIGPIDGDPLPAISITNLTRENKDKGGKAEFKEVEDSKYGKVLALYSPKLDNENGFVGIYPKSNAKGWDLVELGRKVTFSADLNIKAAEGANADAANVHITLNLTGNAKGGEFLTFGNGYNGKGSLTGAANATPASRKNAFTPGKWFHLDIEMDFDGNTLKAYIDGKLAMTQPIVAEGVNTADVHLGPGAMFGFCAGEAGREILIDNVSYKDSIAQRSADDVMPDETPETPDKPNPPTADYAYAVAVVAVISLAGVVIAKKNHR